MFIYGNIYCLQLQRKSIKIKLFVSKNEHQIFFFVEFEGKQIHISGSSSQITKFGFWHTLQLTFIHQIENSETEVSHNLYKHVQIYARQFLSCHVIFINEQPYNGLKLIFFTRFTKHSRDSAKKFEYSSFRLKRTRKVVWNVEFNVCHPWTFRCRANIKHFNFLCCLFFFLALCLGKALFVFMEHRSIVWWYLMSYSHSIFYFLISASSKALVYSMCMCYHNVILHSLPHWFCSTKMLLIDFNAM